MKRILLTGSTGFIGRNIAPLLKDKYDVTAPIRAELDLLDADAVRRYLDAGRFDAVVHLANPTAQNPIDKKDELLERSLRVFAALEGCNDLYGKMIYLGSGAEYGKHRPLTGVTEEQFGEELPRDPYGLSRYIMNKLGGAHDNIINLRLFGCYGAFDPPYKLLPHITLCIQGGREIVLNQDVFFDFIYVEDIFPVIVHFIETERRYGAYNLCSGERVKLSSIASEALRQAGSDLPVLFKKDGLGLEYTGSNLRLLEEFPDFKALSIRDGIKKVFDKESFI